MFHENHYCKRCGDRIPAASPDGIKVIYLGTVGPNSPDVPPDLEGLCFPCLSDDALSAEDSIRRFNESLKRLSKVP